MPKPSTSSGKPLDGKDPALEPLAETLQLGARAYRALWSGIVGGQIESGAQLRPDTIAEQLDISTTPVREALHRLEGDGLMVKLPYKGWFVREFTEQEVRRPLRDARGAGVLRRAPGLRSASRPRSSPGCASTSRSAKAALRADDMDAYRIYNRDLHAAIVEAARNVVPVVADGAARPAEPDADGEDDPARRPSVACDRRAPRADRAHRGASRRKPRAS